MKITVANFSFRVNIEENHTRDIYLRLRYEFVLGPM